MKLSHKLKKLVTPEVRASIGRHTRRDLAILGAAFVRSRVKLPFKLTPEDVLRQFDGPRFREIQSSYAVTAPTVDPPKYISDPKGWLATNIKRLREVHLDYGRRREILDLGCGAGYFIYLCGRLGHRAVGLDLDEEPIFREMVELLQVERRIWRIVAFEPLPDFGRRFDLVTAHLVCFNGHKSDDLWGVAEWAFFLSDLERQLKPRGEIFLRLNIEDNGSAMSSDLAQFFADELRGKIEEYTVHLDRRRFSAPLASRIASLGERRRSV